MLSTVFSGLVAAAAAPLLASAAQITTPPPYVEGHVLFANGDCRSLICLRQFPALTIQ